MKSNLPISNNPDPRKGERVMAKHIAEIKRDIQRLASRDYTEPTGRSPLYIPPFQPYVRTAQVSESQFEIRIGKGFVIEQVVPQLDGDIAQVIYHEPTGISDTETEEPVWHQIQDGECAYVTFSTNDNGVIEGVPAVEILEDEYTPSANQWAFKICKLTISETNLPTIELFHVSDHIQYGTREEQLLPDGGVWGTFRWYLDASLEMELTFENGLLTAASGATAGGSGTEEDPYDINFVVPP